MLKYLKELFIETDTETRENHKSSPHKLEIAACALLLEIAKADDEFNKAEKNRIFNIMREKFNLSQEEAAFIFEESEQSVEESISLYEFTDTLNQYLNNDEKYMILKYLWEIAFADGNLDSYEDHFIKKISNNLHLYNKDRIAAKMEVKKKLGL
jgi:uncharacterized tellurite resistance protein B-like protein